MNGAVSSDVRENDALIGSLLEPSAYVHSVARPVVLIETHISWVLLAGNFAYKINEPMQTDFLDYKTLEKRHHACCEELRLGNRYARGLYLDVVPITFEGGGDWRLSIVDHYALVYGLSSLGAGQGRCNPF